ncbi:MAG: triose-phosphate isomerase [Patescibacteria group bacterium]
MKKYFIANWKMNLLKDQQADLVNHIRSLTFSKDDVSVIVCPSYPNIPAAAEMLKSTAIELGAQDVSWEAEGAMTGEVSAEMLKSFGVEYVVIGHSERRHKMNEDNDMVHKKIATAIASGLTPILCVGETFDQRKQGITDTVLIEQIQTAFAGITLRSHQTCIVAYEPVWVIGTGQAVDPKEAFHSVAVLRETLHDVLHETEANHLDIPILYGGSVHADNVKDFLKDDIKGVLVGGASLKEDEFAAMVKALHD